MELEPTGRTEGGRTERRRYIVVGETTYIDINKITHTPIVNHPHHASLLARQNNSTDL
jgi:hypothetical protein